MGLFDNLYLQVPNKNTTTQASTAPKNSSSSSSSGGGSGLFSTLGTAQKVYNLYNRLFGSGTQTGYGSGLPSTVSPTMAGSSPATTGGTTADLFGGSGGPASGAVGGATYGTGAAGYTGALNASGAAAASGEATAGLAAPSMGLGTIGMLAAPIVMMGLAYGAGSGRNDPVERRNATLQAAQGFSDPNATPSDLGSLYRSMINMSRQGIFGADANSGFTRQQINDMLTKNNPGVTTGMLQQLSNPGGYDAIKQAYNQFLGRDPSESEYQMRLSTLPGYGTDAKWVTGLKQQLADIASSPEAQAYLTTNNKPLITQAQIDNIFKTAWANSVINGTPQTSF